MSEGRPGREVGRRVIDNTNGQLGTVVESFGRGRYRVDWDEPTPHQHLAQPYIPSAFFDWADDE